MELVVQFQGGPCDGLTCSSDSADRMAASTALIWNLIAPGRPTSAILPAAHEGRLTALANGRRRNAAYEVAHRTIESQSVTSIAVYCAGVDRARAKRWAALRPAWSAPLKS